MKLATATQARTYSQIGARSSAQQNNNPPSELDNLIGPEPGAPGPDVYKSALKGAAIGVAAGAAYGLVGRLGYSVGSIPQGGAIQFGTVMASTVVALPPAPLERRERLEQLRALEAGMRIDLALVQKAARGVDTPADLARVRAAFAGEGQTE